MTNAYRWLKNNVIYLVYLQVWLGVLGSLYFSNILKLPPCSLCIYQRMMLYPLVFVLGVSIWRRDRANLVFYSLPFALVGFLIALYHNLIYWKIIPFELIPCSVQLPCTVEDFALFGFITIPLMSLLAFALIIAGLSFYYQTERRRNALD